MARSACHGPTGPGAPVWTGSGLRASAFVMRVFLVVETTGCVVVMMVWLLLWPRCKGGEGA